MIKKLLYFLSHLNENPKESEYYELCIFVVYGSFFICLLSIMFLFTTLAEERIFRIQEIIGTVTASTEKLVNEDTGCRTTTYEIVGTDGTRNSYVIGCFHSTYILSKCITVGSTVEKHSGALDYKINGSAVNMEKRYQDDIKIPKTMFLISFSSLALSLAYCWRSKRL